MRLLFHGSHGKDHIDSANFYLSPKENIYLSARLALLRVGQTERPKAHFAKVYQLDPKDEDNYIDIGLAYLKKGDTPKAAELLAKGFNLKPGKEKLYLKTGIAFLKKS